MPVDPTISLQAHSPSILGDNPLGAIQSLYGIQATQQGIANTQQEMQARALQMQTYQNQIQMFQKTFSGMQTAGQIMAAAPDWESGITQIQKNPDVGFMADTLNKFREQALTQAQIGLTGAETTRARAGTVEALSAAGQHQAETSKIQTELGSSVYDQAKKALLAGIVDPSQVPGEMQRVLASLPPDVAAAHAGTFKNLLSSVMPPYGMDPKAATELYRKNVTGLLLSAGDKDIAGMLFGAPSWQTGPSQVPEPKRGLPEVPLPGEEGGGRGAPDGASPAPAPAPPKLSYLGTPLFSPIPASVPPLSTGLLGGGAKELLSEHQGEERSGYNFASTALGRLTDMDASLDQLAKTGGLLAPGAGGKFRLAFASALNSLSESLGGKPIYDPKTIGAGELLNKDSTHLGFATSKALLPGQKEGVQTIEEAIEAVPGINNTILGGKLVVQSNIAAMKRIQDQWEFKDEWAQKHNGNLTQADAAFNQAFPAEKYAERVLAAYGMDKKGFTSPQALKDQILKGRLTQEQAIAIGKKQWPNGIPVTPTPTPSAPPSNP